MDWSSKAGRIKMPMLTGEKAKLRAAEEEDAKELFRWQNDPDSFGEYENPEPIPWVVFQEQMKQRAQARATGNDNSESFIIETLGEDKKPIGAISCFYPIRITDSCVEIGYHIARPEERRKGYASEAIKLMVDYLFLTHNVNRIQAHAATANIGSARALEKNGFQKEGVARELLFSQGNFRDYYAFSILRREWRKP